MFATKGFLSGCLGALSLSLIALSMQPAHAQVDDGAEALPISEAAVPATLQPENLTARSLASPEATAPEAAAEPMELTYPAEPDATELAQRRRRTRNTVSGADFIGIGADFGYTDNTSFAVISKLSFNEQVAIRPSLLFGDDFAVLVPVTYEFSRYTSDVGGLRLRPYAGVGASYSESGDDENFNLLLSAGADAPLGDRFTLNAQANLGVLNDTDFGVTVGVGYNFGRVLR